ncbi:MAG: hypothetical protein HFI38_12900 [Lachnospiraceae bacterium]|jgi:hypothetical protein|nr:hypothetical protein [Lachnospiraceae bacterium]
MKRRKKKRRSYMALMISASAMFGIVTAAYIMSYRLSTEKEAEPSAPHVLEETGYDILGGSGRDRTEQDESIPDRRQTQRENNPGGESQASGTGTDVTGIADAVTDHAGEDSDQVLPVDDMREVYITPRMSYTLETYDARTASMMQEETTIPSAMYGLNHEELSEYLIQLAEQENKRLQDSEVHYDLVSFSRQNFTIRKTVSEKTIDYALFLIAESGYLTAYTGDRTDVYEYTQIPLGDFPLEQQAMLTRGIFMKTLTDYYDFLESYSS